METRREIHQKEDFRSGLIVGMGMLFLVFLILALFAAFYVLLIRSNSSSETSLLTLSLFAIFFGVVISIALVWNYLRRSRRLYKKNHFDSFRQELSEKNSITPNQENPLLLQGEMESLRLQLASLTQQVKDFTTAQNGFKASAAQPSGSLFKDQSETPQETSISSEKNEEIQDNSHRRLEENVRELYILFNVSQVLTASIDPEALCSKFADVILKNIHLSDFAILLLDKSKKNLIVQELRGFRKSHEVKTLVFKAGEGISGRVLQSKQSIYIPDTSKDQDYLYYKGMKSENGSFLSFPILTKDSVFGVMNFSRREIDAFSQREIKVLSIIVKQLAIALENAYLYAKTKELTLVDDLTGIYNRRHFLRILEMEFKRVKRFQHKLSLLMVDVDYFKKINDRFGHLEGDRILSQLAKLLQKNLREVDTLARYGGEEFAVVLPDTSIKDAEKVADKLRKFVKQASPNILNNQKSRLTVSVGVATFNPEMESIDELIDQADTALYQAKSYGRDCVTVFREDTTVSLRAVQD
ncbi:MAG: GGDEF domain-containing protein [Deltaproteobacteria bacterium]|nr:GGDEF domain-containing protein [Deltaproteobacteria bacterium]